MTEPLLRVEDLRRTYRGRAGLFGGGLVTRAVNGVSFDVMPGETLGLVGESGSGKSTTGRLVMGLEEPDDGRVVFDGTDLTALSSARRKPFRRRMQIVFQDPYAALNPRMRVGDFVAEPLVVHGIAGSAAERREAVAGLFRTVGLDPAFMQRFPHEFSGGQRQRIGIARAIALRPQFLVADEPITALDVSIQAQIVNLFQDLQESMGLALLFIAHDLSMVRYLCTRVAVMLKGRIVETGPTAAVFQDARHPYTQALLSAVPIPDPLRERGRRRLPFDAGAFDFPPGAALRDIGGGHLVLEGASR
ncbi:ABC transporter ATP-binding protein [Roseomonas sp. AR75]|uniref:ABC transporter ATP-binding protein n=1 Tax=Roseomonas sp. AR75 TaxID=2562311 RepID=UPI0010C0DCC8|nr:ATP-binding cassette domain-containing protein [Roseomonas sp. AR75]